jgi:glycosyltransferase involved in cell wall biosynthesis
MKPRVSVVMANYNYGRYLATSVESVLSQTMPDLELIVADDGSTDNSMQVLERYAGDGRVRAVQLHHVGQSRAKNAAVDAATGPLIAFIDADDCWQPDKLARQVEIFDANENVGVVYTRRTLIDENGKPLDSPQPALHRGDVLEAIFRTNFVCFSSAVACRVVLDHVGGFDPALDLAVDYDLWLRIAPHYRFDYVDAPLVQYRVGHGNLSRRAGERLRTVLMLMNRFLYERGGSERIGRDTIRNSLADTYCSMGLALRPFTRLQSCAWFAHALAQRPSSINAWRGLAGACVPAAWRGKWELAYRSPANDPRNV